MMADGKHTNPNLPDPLQMAAMRQRADEARQQAYTTFINQVSIQLYTKWTDDVGELCVQDVMDKLCRARIHAELIYTIVSNSGSIDLEKLKDEAAKFGLKLVERDE